MLAGTASLALNLKASRKRDTALLNIVTSVAEPLLFDMAETVIVESQWKPGHFVPTKGFLICICALIFTFFCLIIIGFLLLFDVVCFQIQYYSLFSDMGKCAWLVHIP